VRARPRRCLRRHAGGGDGPGRQRAIIGMRYDATEIASGITEVLAYGTAVVVERAP
jgi:hypothetical protein